MIGYDARAEKVLYTRKMLDYSLINLRRRMDAAIKRAGPAGYPTASFRDDSACGAPHRKSDILNEIDELVTIQRQIDSTKTERDLIDSVLAQMNDVDREILRLWYIERVGKDKISEQMHYESRATLYRMRNEAVHRFAILYYGIEAFTDRN